MIHLSRRRLIATAGLLAAGFSTDAFAGTPADLSDILTPPEEGDMTLGPDTAKVTMVEYGSASCPHCAAFYKDTFQKLKTDYIDTGKMRFIFREFPHNDQGLAAFMVARCAPKEKYYPLLDTFFSTQTTWVPDPFNGLKSIAQQAGMSEEDFKNCLKNEKVAKAILDVRQKGSDKYGVTGIPMIFVGDKASGFDKKNAFDGETTYDVLKKVIDPLL